MQYIYKEQKLEISIDVFKGQSSVKEDFLRSDMKLFLVRGADKRRIPQEVVINDEGTLVLSFEPRSLKCDVYGLKLVWGKNDDKSTNLAEQYNLFAVTEYSNEATNATAQSVKLSVKLKVATYGYDGLDAYELAVLRGVTNLTEEEWLESRSLTAVLQNEGDNVDASMSQAAITASLEKIRNILGSAYNLIGKVNSLPKKANKNDVVFLSTDKHSYVCASLVESAYTYWNVKSPSVPKSVQDIIKDLNTNQGKLVTLSDADGTTSQSYVVLGATSSGYYAYVSTDGGDITDLSHPLAYDNGKLGLMGTVTTSPTKILNIELVTVSKGDAIWTDIGELSTIDYTPKASDTEFTPAANSMLQNKTNVQDGLDEVGVKTPSIELNMAASTNENVDIINSNFAALQAKYNRLLEVLQLLIDNVEFSTANGFSDVEELISQIALDKVNVVRRITSGGAYSASTAISGEAVSGTAISGTI